jgi:hypothetical protein
VPTGAGQDVGAAELPDVNRLLNELLGHLIGLDDSAGTASREVAPVWQAGFRQRCIFVEPPTSCLGMPDGVLHLHG